MGLDEETLRRDLQAHGMAADLAAQYAEAFCEYQTAAAHVRQHGVIIQHPRTGTPIENPFAAVRDRASVRLRRLGQGIDLDWLWAVT